MRLPSPRGPLSALLAKAMRGEVAADDSALVAVAEHASEGRSGGDQLLDLVVDDDFQVSLWMLYELHYLGFEDVAAEQEWEPGLLGVRRMLEGPFEQVLRLRTDGYVDGAVGSGGDVATRMFELTETFEGPSVPRFLQRGATRAQFTEFLVHRSVYHLRESDPSSWAIPRLSGRPKAALVELLYDEYGAGRPDRLHATMFADGLQACGLDRSYGAYVDQVPAYTLAVNNAMSLFGLHRRWRAAGMGHLGAFEATSSLPCRRLVGGTRRLGMPMEVTEYFDEHVEADAVHEQLALRNICGELVRQDPSLERDVFFGAAVCLDLDAVAGRAMLDAWQSDRTSLRASELDPGAVA